MTLYPQRRRWGTGPRALVVGLALAVTASLAAKGGAEPFFGMGTASQPVDFLLWRASWDAGPAGYPDVDTLYPNMAVDQYPFERPGNGPRPHSVERQAPEYLTGRAAGNALSEPGRGFSGSSLQARGFGTLTMRPRASQAVSARGTWADGRWTVVLRRPLAVAEEAGIPLAPGERVSIAFALWDGAAHDRNGQKLISMWNDLQLE